MRRDGVALNRVLRIFPGGDCAKPTAYCPGASQVDQAVLHIGAAAVIDRFGSSLYEHVHFHVCVVAEVF